MKQEKVMTAAALRVLDELAEVRRELTALREEEARLLAKRRKLFRKGRELERPYKNANTPLAYRILGEAAGIQEEAVHEALRDRAG